MVALESEMNPLSGLRSAYYICKREPLSGLSRLRRWLIRLVYFKCEWASDYSIEDMGIFTDRDVAEAIAAQKRTETGKAWSVKELPINGLLPDVRVRYGFYSFPGNEVDAKYRERRSKFVAIPSQGLKALADVEAKLDHLQGSIQGCAKAS